MSKTTDKQFSILIVDDNPKNIQIAASILREAGYKTAFAKDGKLALNHIRIKKPDLVLLDIMMPEMDGFQVCEILKTNPETSDIPIIFLTAKTDTESIVKGFKLGAADYITKPFNSDELHARVKNHLQLKQAKQKLEEANNQLKELNATKDKFFSIIAHDLKTPFNSLIGGTELLLQYFDNLPEKDKKGLIHGMNISSKQAFDLLQNLLQWSRSQTGLIRTEPKSIDIYYIVYETVTLLGNHAKGKDILLINDINKDTFVYADPSMISTVIRNLISNGIKYTKQGGEIRIYSKEKDSMIEISVSDTGVGITRENIDKLFRIDVRHSTPGTAKEQGTGLGLNLCKEFVEKNRGEIGVESEFEKGSRFYFTLPKSNLTKPVIPVDQTFPSESVITSEQQL